MTHKTAINQAIVEARTGMLLTNYLQKCIDTLEKMSDKGMLNGLGELMDEEMKRFVRNKMRSETISLLKFYLQFPLLAD
jgi:hypothetical protein